ncbi:MAG: tetratricopeptide repeat protein [Phycisphaerales bacterium]|nr:tetratricopeptide repeat protein [Phycisphaerales bacterium]
MMRRVSVAVLVVVGMMWGCQGTRSTGATAATTMVAASQPELVPPYTHEAATTLYREAKYKQAETMCLKAIAAIEKEKGEKAWEIASPLDDLATVYLRQARYREAESIIARAESLLDKNNKEQGILLARLAINKGWQKYAMGDARGAEKAFVRGRDLIQKWQKDDSLVLAELINNLGLMYEEAAGPAEMPSPKRVTQARLMLYKSWQMRKLLAGEESYESQESLNNIGMHLLYHGEGENVAEMAINTLRKALEMSEKVYGKEHPETAMSRVNLAMALKLNDDDAAAEEQIRRAMPVTEKYFGKDHPDRQYQLMVLGMIEQGRGNYEEAEKYFLEAVRIAEVTYGPTHENVAGAVANLRDLYEEMNDEAKMKAAEKRAEKLRGKEI